MNWLEEKLEMSMNSLENVLVRIDGKIHTLDCVDYDEENKCLLWYVFDRQEPYSEKEHKIEVIDDESDNDEY